MKLSKKILDISSSATLAVTTKVTKLREQGYNIISFGAGEPDFDTPEPIREAAKKAIDDGFTHYTNVSGITELKETIVEKLIKDNHLNYETKNILVSNGAKHSLYNAIMAIVEPGDEVIVSSPFWVSYSEMIKLAGGTPVFVDTKLEDGFAVKSENIKKCITDKTKCIIVNTPSNPTGCVLGKKELEKIGELANENDLLIISDEIYEKLIYEGEHYSIAQVSEEIKKRTILINGVSKAYAMTGWRIGYMAADERIIKQVSKLQGHSTSNPNSIAQKAAIAALRIDEKEIDKMKVEFIKRRDYMYTELSKMGKFIMPPKPKGAFYIFVNVEKFNMSSLEFCDFALEKVKVALVPGVAFGKEKYVRLSYANSFEEIKEGIKRLKSL